MIAAPEDMDREDIKAAIRKTGITLNELSRQNGYSIVAVRVALRRQWPAVEAIVARHLGKQPWAIWPSRYGPDQLPLRGVRSNKPDTNRRPVPAHRQKHEAV